MAWVKRYQVEAACGELVDKRAAICSIGVQRNQAQLQLDRADAIKAAGGATEDPILEPLGIDFQHHVLARSYQFVPDILETGHLRGFDANIA